MVVGDRGGVVFLPEPPRGLGPVGGNTSAIMYAKCGVLAASDDAGAIGGLLGLAMATWWLGSGTGGAYGASEVEVCVGGSVVLMPAPDPPPGGGAGRPAPRTCTVGDP